MMKRLLSLISLLFAVGAPGSAWAQAAAPRVDAPPPIQVGDTWRWVRSDRRSGQQEAETKRVVTAVTPTRIEGTENAGTFVMSNDLAMIESPEFVRASADAKFITFPLEVGRKWSFAYDNTNKSNGSKTRWQLDSEVVGYEKVKVPAGEFDAFKIATKGFWNHERGLSGRPVVTTWYAPAARAVVRSEYDEGRNSTATQLMEYTLKPAP